MTPELRLPRAAEGVHRTQSPGALGHAPGIQPAFADPCAGADSQEDWLTCQADLDPLVLY